jgi:hypothetical protein
LPGNYFSQGNTGNNFICAEQLSEMADGMGGAKRKNKEADKAQFRNGRMSQSSQSGENGEKGGKNSKESKLEEKKSKSK